MYVRPQSFRYPSGVRLPENYGGNAFRESAAPTEESEGEKAEAVVKDEQEPSPPEATEALLPKQSGFGLRLGSLFGKSGIGTEELLILSLILLLADGDGNEDLILFLLLLFFIK